MPSSETGFAAHHLLSPKRPMAPSTYTAHVVRLYTNARGKYVATAQQARSHFRAQFFARLRKGVGGGDGDVEPLVTICALGVTGENGISLLSSWDRYK